MIKKSAEFASSDFQYLDDEERELLEGFDEAWDNGHYGNGASQEDIDRARASAKATIDNPSVKITTRLSKNDLTALKAKALSQGIPYQTLLASVVHRYVEGTLKEA